MRKKTTAKEAWRRRKHFKKVCTEQNKREIAKSNGEYVKVRVQSTPEEITGFHQFLDKCEELGLCQVLNFSEMFPNQGTSKYFRAYSDVKIEKEGVDND